MLNLMQIMRSCSAGFLWVFVFWFNLKSCFGANEIITLQAKQWVSAQCGGNVTLTCDASSSLKDIKIIDFLWTFGNNTKCKHDQDRNNSEFQCKYTNGASNHIIALTLLNVMPKDEGKYFCKLRSTVGSRTSESQLRLDKCLPHLDSGFSGSMNDTHATCSFEGFYPSGVVHWSQEGNNLTEHAHTINEKDAHERFIVRSTINATKENQYNCSLWIPSLGEYIATKTISSGSVVRLQWIWIVVTMMVSFMM